MNELTKTPKRDILASSALQRGAGWALLALSGAVTCFAQGRVSEFVGIKSWQGTVTITGKGSGTASGGIYSDVWNYSIASSATIQLPTIVSNIEGWTGTFAGTTSVNASDVASFGSCNETLTQTGSVPLGVGKTFTLHLQGNNQYVFYPSDYLAAGGTNSVSFDCAPGTEGGPSPITWAPVLSSEPQNLPSNGFSLKGSETLTMNSPMQPLSEVFGGTPAVINVTVQWDFEPSDAPALQVVVQSTDEYQNFRPTAGDNGARGNSLDLIAKVQLSDGTPQQAAYFLWEMTQSSKEPGFAMNAPFESPGTDFDFKLESGSPAFLTLDPTGQKAQTVVGLATQATATIASFDWGAFGRVKVTAVMPDGQKVVGFLEGDSSQTEVRLPKRAVDSMIADVWKSNNGITGADNSDNETDPVGDGHAGDGLTLYEEYRGFIIDGNHVEGNPKKKDFFIVNEEGQSYQPGIKLFQQLSGLEVHYTLKRTEMSDTRVVNRYHNQGPHRVDQHGVLIVAFAGNPGYAEALGGPGTPKSIAVVNLRSLPPDMSDHSVQYWASTLAHELFHACNVYHHGEKEYPQVTWVRFASLDLVLENNSSPVDVRKEPSGDGSTDLPDLTVVNVTLGLNNDQHSGDDNCVMRYDDAEGYTPQAGPANARYHSGSEPAGFGLCTQSAGAGVNDANHQPQSRYGNAAENRGNCAGQILVNDGVSAPTR